MLKKEEFIDIVQRIQKANDVSYKVSKLLSEYSDINVGVSIDIDILLTVGFDLIVDILDKVYDTDMVSYWFYECNNGRSTSGAIMDENNKEIDISTPEKLYDYIINKENTI